VRKNAKRISANDIVFKTKTETFTQSAQTTTSAKKILQITLPEPLAKETFKKPISHKAEIIRILSPISSPIHYHDIKALITIQEEQEEANEASFAKEIIQSIQTQLRSNNKYWNPWIAPCKPLPNSTTLPTFLLTMTLKNNKKPPSQIKSEVKKDIRSFLLPINVTPMTDVQVMGMYRFVTKTPDDENPEEPNIVIKNYTQEKHTKNLLNLRGDKETDQSKVHSADEDEINKKRKYGENDEEKDTQNQGSAMVDIS